MSVPARMPQGGWLKAALDITHPSQFAVWEPVLEEMAGARPVPWQDIRIGRIAEMVPSCGHALSLGCFHTGRRTIHLSSEHSPGELGRIGALPLGGARCPGLSGEGLTSYPVLGLYAHEQGHSFDRSIGQGAEGRWIDQVEAVLFEFYFAERVAGRFDRRLGLDLYLKLLQRASSDRILLSDGSWIRGGDDDLTERIALIRKGVGDPWCEGLAFRSAFALVGQNLPDFAHAWRYVNTSTHEEVIGAIESRGRDVAMGRSHAHSNAASMAGIDASPGRMLEDLDLLADAEGGCLSGRAPAKTMLLGNEEGGIKAYLRCQDEGSRMKVLFSYAQGPSLICSLCHGSSCSRWELDRRGGSSFRIEMTHADPPFCLYTDVESTQLTDSLVRASMEVLSHAIGLEAMREQGEGQVERTGSHAQERMDR